MKFTKLLVMSALWLVGLSANAADLIERTAPEAPSPTVDVSTIERTPAQFVVGNYYVLFNKGAQQFFTEGNSWGTQASLGDGANLARFTVPDGKTLEDAALLFNDFSPVKNSWKLVFFDSATAMFVDRGTQPDYFWQVVPGDGANTYRLQASPANPSLNPTNNPGFVGTAVDAAAGSALSPFLEEGWIDWEFYSVPEWNAYGPLKDIYDQSVKLKAAIESAEAAGLDVAKWVAVYNNLDATLEQINAAIDEINEAKANNLQNATGHNPQDASGWITNATFDTVGNFTGWQGTAFGAGGNTSTNAEHYDRDFNTYQDVKVLYPGLYAIGVNAFYRAGSSSEAYEHFTANDAASKAARLYGTVGDQTEETPIASIYAGAPSVENPPSSTTDMIQSNGFWIPNYMTSANYCMHELGLYKNYVFMEIPADATLRIGVKKENHIATEWAIFDDFSLTFFGNGADRFYGWAKVLADAAPEITATAVTQSYVDAYNAAKAIPEVNGKDDVLAYKANLENAQNALSENIRLWKVYEDSVAIAKDFVQKYIDQGSSSMVVQMLHSYCNQDVDKYPGYFENGSAIHIIALRAMDNEALVAEIAFLRSMIDDIIKGVEVKPGTELTDRMANPAFDNSWTGWTREGNLTGNVAVSNSCAECWNTASFDVYQQVNDMPIGVYEISVQGFYRYGRGTAWADYKANPNMQVPTYIYMNNNTTPFTNIFGDPKQITDEGFYAGYDDEGNVLTTNKKSSDYNSNTADDGTVYWFPNGMASAAVAFADGMYMNTAYGAVISAGEPMRIGVKGSSNQLGDSWVIFDNFKLTYWGTEHTKVDEALKAAIADVETSLSAGLTKDVAEGIQNALAAARAAIGGTDGPAMFQVLADLYASKNGLNEAKERMANLNSSLEALDQAILDLGDNGYIVANISDWTSALRLRASQNDIFDSEIDDLMKQIDAYKEQLAKVDEVFDARQDLDDALTAVSESGELDEGIVTYDWVMEAESLGNQFDEAASSKQLTLANIDEWIEKFYACISKKYAPTQFYGSDENPQELTQMVQSAKFSKVIEGVETNAIDGWKGTDGYNFGNDDTQKGALALEYYHKAFDMYQVFYGLPEGIYEVRANAFFRKDNAESTNTVLYANTDLKAEQPTENQKLVKAILEGAQAEQPTIIETKMNEETGDEETVETKVGGSTTNEAGETVYIPSDMVSSVVFFNLESKPYQNKVYAKVGADGSLRIGIKTQDANTWAIMDDFQLFYYGANSSKEATGDGVTSIKEVAGNMAATVLRTEYYTMNGQRTLAPQKGIVIMRQTLSNGAVIVKKLNLK
ncbi:MAG: hypothetical protein IJ841_00475 [Prevotella sp.]|nr:hypothetical protein [Prevotella sp.]